MHLISAASNDAKAQCEYVPQVVYDHVQLVFSAQPKSQDLVQLAGVLLPNCFALVDSCVVRPYTACQLVHTGIFRCHFYAVLLLRCHTISEFQVVGYHFDHVCLGLMMSP